MFFNKYTTDFLVIFLIVFGLIFLSIGIASYTGFVSVSEESEIQDPIIMGHTFTSIGVVVFVIGFISSKKYYKGKKIRMELIANGIPVVGLITSVRREYLLRVYMTGVGSRSPYIIYYSYTHLGKVYNAKSHYIWGSIEYEQDEEIPVYVDNFGNSAIDI